MKPEIVRADVADKAILRRHLDDCLSELAVFGEVDFAYPYLDAYWDPAERRWPYLVRQGGEVAGFALVNTVAPSGRDTDFAMAEFYIVPDARRQGDGRAAAAALFRMHRGVWELGIMPSNAPARRFWPKAIAASGATGVERLDRDDAVIYRFSTA